MGAAKAHVNFDAPAILRKWPSRNNQRCTEGTGLDDGKNVANDPKPTCAITRKRGQGLSAP